MYWILLITLSATALGFYDVSKKHAVHGNAVMPVLFFGTAVGTAAVIVALLATGQLMACLAVGWLAWWKLLLKAAVVTGSWICAYYAMRQLPISIAAPIRGSQPVWTLAGALLLFAERPSRLQWAGIAMTLVGYWLFTVLGRREGIHFERHRGIALIFLATLLGAVSSLYDKYLLQPCSLRPEAVQLWFQLDLVTLIGICWLAQRLAGLARTGFAWRWSIPAVGILLVISDWLYFTALHQPDTLISILSPIRRANCVISFFVGATLFKDHNPRGKAIALACILLGVVLLCLAGR